MSWITQNAPFGTDNTPVLQVKIVGGKRVEVLVDRENSNPNKKSNISPPRGPNGTPSMLTQPPFMDYDSTEYSEGFTTAKQHQLARQVTSFTSPNGDRSRSFRHGVPLLNKHPILPPIGVSQPPGTLVAHPNEFSMKEQQLDDLRGFHTQEKNASLETIVAQGLVGYRYDKLKDMYIELTGFDRHLSGFVNEAQLSLIAMRYNLPLKQSVLKLLFSRFADPNDSRSVNYEKLLHFLSTCLLNPSVLDRHSSTSLNLNLDEVTQHSSPNKASSTSPGKSGRFSKAALMRSGNIDEKLLSLLKEQLRDCDEINLAELRRAFMGVDRLANGQLSSDVIQAVCIQQRLPLTKSVIIKMLKHAETSHGNVSWTGFLELLACADDRLDLDAVNGDLEQNNGHVAGSGVSLRHPAAAEVSPGSNRKDIYEIDRRTQEDASSQQKAKNRVSAAARSDQSLASSKQSRSMPKGWDEHEPRPIPRKKLAPDDLSPRRTDTWLHNFTRLAHALRSYHPYKSEALPRTEVQRMAANYNLIYGLGFSSQQIDDAIGRAVTSHSKEVKDQTVSVARLLDALAEM